MSVPASIFNVGDIRPPFPLDTRRGSDAERVEVDAESAASPNVNKMLTNDLMWVRSPDFAGWLVKKGFRWRKLWKKRWVVLDGRDIAYMSDHPDNEHDMESLQVSRIELQEDMAVNAEDIEGHPFGFILHPGGASEPWYLRAANKQEKKEWLGRLRKVNGIVKWLAQYEKGRLLGVGGSGVVYEIINKRTGARSALKEIEIQNKVMREMCVAEAETLKRLSETVTHPNILTIEKVFDLGSKFNMMFPLCTGGELYERVIKRGCFSEADAARYTKQLASALQALHANNILHLDIKPENILFETEDADSIIKLTDFGLARVLNPGEDQSTPADAPKTMGEAEDRAFWDAGIAQRERLRGTVGYMAPEIITRRHYSPAADVWASGVVLYILLAGYPPFHSASNREIMDKTCKGQYSLEGKNWENVSDAAKDLVRRMLTVDPAQRITVAGILQHPWIVNDEAPETHLAVAHEDMRKLVSQARNMKLAMTFTRLMSTLNGQELDVSTLLGTDVNIVSDEEVVAMAVDMREQASSLFTELGEGAKLSYEQMSEFLSRLDLDIRPDMLCRFLDRDRDRFISADDIIQTHAMVVSRSDEFIRAIFRFYTERAWYPGKALNSITRTMIASPTHNRNPSGDLVGPPKYITRRNFVAVFEQSDFGGEAGGRIFDVLYRIIKSSVSGPYADNSSSDDVVPFDDSKPAENGGHEQNGAVSDSSNEPDTCSTASDTSPVSPPDLLTGSPMRHRREKSDKSDDDKEKRFDFVDFKKATLVAPVIMHVVTAKPRKKMLDAFKTGSLRRELRRIASDVKDEDGKQLPRESDDYKQLPRISDVDDFATDL